MATWLGFFVYRPIANKGKCKRGQVSFLCAPAKIFRHNRPYRVQVPLDSCHFSIGLDTLSAITDTGKLLQTIGFKKLLLK